MSESLKPRSEDDINRDWESLQEDATWLEQQRDQARARGDEATAAKAEAHIAEDRANQEKLLAELDGTTATSGDADESDDGTDDAEVPTMDFSEAPKEQSKPYEYNYVTKDGLVHNISADTQEELNKKIKELQEYDQDITSWH